MFDNDRRSFRSLFDNHRTTTKERTTQAVIRLTPEEKELARRYAAGKGLTLSWWLRDLMRDEIYRPAPPPARGRGRPRGS